MAIFTSGKAEFTTRRLMQGFGLTVVLMSARRNIAFPQQVSPGRTTGEEDACNIQSPAESGRRGSVGQARRHQEERTQGRVEGMYESMSEKQLEEFAETKRKGLPEKKKTKH